MSEWQIVNIAEVCSDIIDCVNRTAPTVDYPTPYKMIRTTNVKNGWIDTDNVRYVSEETYVRWARRGELQRGDVILTREAPLGEVGIIRHDDTIFMGQRLMMYRADPKQLDAFFLLYAMQEQYLQGQIRAYGSGSTVEHMRVPDAKKLNIFLPPLPTQRRIAAILSAYDDLIENNTRRIQALEQAAHDLYREWFVAFRFPGHESVPLVDSGTEYGMIPQGWGVRTVGQSFEILGGGTPSTTNPEYWEDGDIVWFSPSDLTAANAMFISDSSKHITSIGLQKSSAKMFPAYSVMMTSRATLGVTAINTVPACTNQGFITCIPNERVSAYQIYFWIAENLEKIISVASGATFKEINKTTFRQFPFLISDKNITDQFNQIVEPIGNQIENLLHRNNALREARDLLLPRLVSGEMSVEDVETPHP